ncbi:hypothetical protein CIRG_05869 [Coccidioides immitis RMSCC 2394]|uniref:Uncharacterized protein n=1 Tax=Coccidioides immitis RMSCC 2394 TaxID=404692 RepID=A0A0J6YH24_COCIT|nr:hypothetical protein CIRG_05869 [Coccidioides immitis RMSCC 2394]
MALGYLIWSPWVAIVDTCFDCLRTWALRHLSHPVDFEGRRSYESI